MNALEIFEVESPPKQEPAPADENSAITSSSTQPHKEEEEKAALKELSDLIEDEQGLITP